MRPAKMEAIDLMLHLQEWNGLRSHSYIYELTLLGRIMVLENLKYATDLIVEMDKFHLGSNSVKSKRNWMALINKSAEIITINGIKEVSK